MKLLQAIIENSFSYIRANLLPNANHQFGKHLPTFFRIELLEIYSSNVRREPVFHAISFNWYNLIN